MKFGKSKTDAMQTTDTLVESKGKINANKILNLFLLASFINL